MKKQLLLIVVAVVAIAVVLAACGEPAAIPTGGNPASGGETLVTGGSAPTGGMPVVAGGTSPSAYAMAVPIGNGQQTGIWVNGTGKATAVPDVAVLNLGVEARASTVAEANRQAAAAMDAIMQSLKANGVAEKDIKTQYFSISPVYRWVEERSEQIITGYSVSNSVTAKIRDISKAGTIIDGAAEVGGDLTRVNGISLMVEDPTPYENEAREAALRATMAKAQQMASVAGVTLGKPVYITESGSYYPQPIRYAMKEDMAGAPVPTPITPISAGETEISVSVQMVFAIE